MKTAVGICLCVTIGTLAAPAVGQDAAQNVPPEYRQFDFWVGQWEVVSPQGQKVGSNVITKSDKGFVITEKWTSARGGTGTSLNYYDPAAKRWKQVWVDMSGNIIRYSGTWKDGAMRMSGDTVARNGTKGLSRMTFTPQEDGRVHQFIEQSADGGKTWSVYFNGYYVKKK